MIRGVRGATTVQVDTDIEIMTAVERLLREMIELNSIEAENVASIFISMTEDLRSAFPAKALRKIDGWTYVPVVCMQEIPIVNSLPLCIRVMLHLNTNKKQTQIQHVYQEGAIALRPDLFTESQ